MRKFTFTFAFLTAAMLIGITPSAFALGQLRSMGPTNPGMTTDAPSLMGVLRLALMYL